MQNQKEGSWVEVNRVREEGGIKGNQATQSQEGWEMSGWRWGYKFGMRNSGRMEMGMRGGYMMSFPSPSMWIPFSHCF